MPTELIQAITVNPTPPDLLQKVTDILTRHKADPTLFDLNAKGKYGHTALRMVFDEIVSDLSNLLKDMHNMSVSKLDLRQQIVATLDHLNLFLKIANLLLDQPSIDVNAADEAGDTPFNIIFYIYTHQHPALVIRRTKIPIPEYVLRSVRDLLFRANERHANWDGLILKKKSKQKDEKESKEEVVFKDLISDEALGNAYLFNLFRMNTHVQIDFSNLIRSFGQNRVAKFFPQLKENSNVHQIDVVFENATDKVFFFEHVGEHSGLKILSYAGSSFSEEDARAIIQRFKNLREATFLVTDASQAEVVLFTLLNNLPLQKLSWGGAPVAPANSNVFLSRIVQVLICFPLSELDIAVRNLNLNTDIRIQILLAYNKKNNIIQSELDKVLRVNPLTRLALDYAKEETDDIGIFIKKYIVCATYYLKNAAINIAQDKTTRTVMISAASDEPYVIKVIHQTLQHLFNKTKFSDLFENYVRLEESPQVRLIITDDKLLKAIFYHIKDKVAEMLPENFHAVAASEFRKNLEIEKNNLQREIKAGPAPDLIRNLGFDFKRVDTLQDLRRLRAEVKTRELILVREREEEKRAIQEQRAAISEEFYSDISSDGKIQDELKNVSRPADLERIRKQLEKIKHNREEAARAKARQDSERRQLLIATRESILDYDSKKLPKDTFFKHQIYDAKTVEALGEIKVAIDALLLEIDKYRARAKDFVLKSYQNIALINDTVAILNSCTTQSEIFDVITNFSSMPLQNHIPAFAPSLLEVLYKERNEYLEIHDQKVPDDFKGMSPEETAHKKITSLLQFFYLKIDTLDDLIPGLNAFRESFASVGNYLQELANREKNSNEIYLVKALRSDLMTVKGLNLFYADKQRFEDRVRYVLANQNEDSAQYFKKRPADPLSSPKAGL